MSPAELQSRFADLLSRQALSHGEVCAVCVGLKKINGFAANHMEFRYRLYETLYDLAKRCGASVDEGGGGATMAEIDQMAVVQVGGDGLLKTSISKSFPISQ